MVDSLIQALESADEFLSESIEINSTLVPDEVISASDLSALTEVYVDGIRELKYGGNVSHSVASRIIRAAPDTSGAIVVGII